MRCSWANSFLNFSRFPYFSSVQRQGSTGPKEGSAGPAQSFVLVNGFVRVIILARSQREAEMRRPKANGASSILAIQILVHM